MAKSSSDFTWKLIQPFAVVGGLIIFLVISVQLALAQFTDSSHFTGCPVVSSSNQADPSETVAIWSDLSLSPPKALAAQLSVEDKQVLGASTSEKWIEIDLKRQLLIAHNGDSIFLQSPIDSGLLAQTPVGEYRIWNKVLSAKLESGSRLNHTYYYLPNVPYSLYFKDNYAIHGAYWQTSFGQPSGFGCVDTPVDVAEKLFYWTDPQLPDCQPSVQASSDNPGTKVIVHN